MTERSGNRQQQYTILKRQGDCGRRSAARDVGDDWRSGSHVDRKATERVYVGGKDTKREEDGLDSADMEEEIKGDMHDPGKYRGVTLLSQVLKLLERVLDAMLRRRVGDFGGNSNDSGRGGGKQTGCTS